MKLIVKEPYMSLNPFESDDLSDLVIVTGINGSGKTQLLNILSGYRNGKPLEKKIEFEFDPPKIRIQFEGLAVENSRQFSYEHWRTIIRQCYDSFNQLTLEERNYLDFVLATDFWNKPGSQEPESIMRYNELLVSWGKNARQRIAPPILQNLQRLEHVVKQRVATNLNIKSMQLARLICRDTGKNIDDLKEVDFYNCSAVDQLVDESDLFSSQFELVFYNYALRRDRNRKKYFFQQVNGERNNAVSDSEFEKNNKAPWDVFNEAMEEHNIDFYFKGVSKEDFSTDVPIPFYLFKKSTDLPILFADLSDGEKMIIGLVLKLFTSTHYGESLRFPEMILLDEPDAHLHPEMSKLLLDVLANTFVGKLGVKVIITTHSPSTVALAPEESIYRLNNGDKSSLTKTTKDEALQLLTGFIPTLSIDYKNHRQVFVESPTDVFYYQLLHDKYQQEKRLNSKLYFISNGYGKGNCDQVYTIVEKIRESGNTTAYGIVDWDTKNLSNAYVHVHGWAERYSVENFILDPVYLICLLVELNNAHKICQLIGISENDNQYLLGNEPDKRLQEIVAVFFHELEKKFPTCKYDGDMQVVEYLNGRQIMLPKWFLSMNGHEIVGKVKLVFTALNKYSSEGQLQIDLIRIMGKCFPFVPKTTIRLIEDITS
ncbi:putative AbiEii toxin of type IV toxin-antitoxin system [Lacibacter cauensis]|uniref:Putative AbiEii toxin of type IV toxin-antitoxin system n=1 Tax=Lacibacter cauensis TaxID=510947 RepID=A0A562S9C8_9BACT|nr:AAA family ATPase [Lacibacter cauensis]TWI77928.1 putative AbiEii toxin of type IV toxin-antitoxin system [Lacibacter cauensis]